MLLLLQPDDMEVSNGLLKKFQADPQMIIPETAITSNRCLVLPKLVRVNCESGIHTITLLLYMYMQIQQCPCVLRLTLPSLVNGV